LRVAWQRLACNGWPATAGLQRLAWQRLAWQRLAWQRLACNGQLAESG